MNQLSYTFSGGKEAARMQVYRQEDLRRMTLFQLRDLCEREKIIHAAMDRMDRDELIQLLLRFRGNRTPKLIALESAEGLERLEQTLGKAQLRVLPEPPSVPAKLTAFNGLDTNCFDGYSLPYRAELDGVNAAVVDAQGGICALWRVESYSGVDCLYLTRSGKLPCREADVQDYRVYLFPQKLSDQIWGVYQGELPELPPQVQLYVVPLMSFSVREPAELAMPLAIDFGTSNTVAGVYLDHAFYAKIQDGIQKKQLKANAVNYVLHLAANGESTPLLPSAIGVDEIENGTVRWRIGIEAEQMAGNGYLGEGMCVFYDIKRWVSSYAEEEKLTDYRGRSLMLERSAIIGAYLRYVVACAEQRFKCRVKNLYIPYPVKQRERFLSLYRELLPEYNVALDDAIDEGASVIYSTIASLIDEKRFEDGTWYKALIIDCGGGTTDLSSCEFSIRDNRVAYDISIETAYENGDTDFGGNNLTYRILQLIKIAAARAISGTGESVEELTANLDTDLYRLVDECGTDAVYERLERAYAAAEAVIPTRFQEYEYRGRDEYYMVKNNYYLLFSLAEKAKKIFFSYYQVLQVAIDSSDERRDGRYVMHLLAPRWKLAVKNQNGVPQLQKEFPRVLLGTSIVKAVLKANIYDIVGRFLGKLYENRELSEYNIIKLTGQSCKIGLFRDCIKEFIPGRLIQQRQGSGQDSYELKLCCLEGMIRYISDKRLGYAKVNITTKTPALPYLLTAYTHKGEPVVLLHSLDRGRIWGSISRSLESVELRLTLSNAEGEEKYIYSIYCEPESFANATYEEIGAQYGEQITQDCVDVIENGEVRYFVWADKGQWGFSVVPVARSYEQLRVGPQQLFPFENDNWMVNYFDGTR